MNDKKLQIHAALGVRCIEFLRRRLGQFDMTRLEYIRLYDRTGQATTRGTWGRCSFPSRRKKRPGYRIRCSVAIAAREFPYPVKWAVGTRKIDATRWDWVWREDRFHNIEEAFVWVTGHEAFHWLRHSRQIPGRNYETQANRYGFDWLDEWRALTDEAATHDERGTVHLRVQGELRISTVDTSKARLCYPDGRVSYFEDQAAAYAVWLALPKGVHVAFRGANDTTPVYPHDYVDAP